MGISVEINWYREKCTAALSTRAGHSSHEEQLAVLRRIDEVVAKGSHFLFLFFTHLNENCFK